MRSLFRGRPLSPGGMQTSVVDLHAEIQAGVPKCPIALSHVLVVRCALWAYSDRYSTSITPDDGNFAQL